MRVRAALLAMMLLATPSFAAKPAKAPALNASGAPGKLVIPPRITDIAAAGEAAYKARDAARVFEAYGQWIADGEVPLNGHIYDRLALAALKLGPVSSREDDYWNLSKNSGERTGYVVYREWYRAVRHPTEPDVALFKESLGFGDWFSAYMYSEMGRFQRYDHRSAGAIESHRKAIAIEPSCYGLRELGELGPNDAKSRKQQVMFTRRAAALAESRGQIDEKAYQSLRYEGPEFLQLLAGMPLEEQFRRERSTKNDSPPIEEAAWLFASGHRDAFLQKIASLPRSATVLYWSAMDRLQHGDTAYAQLDQLFADALALEPSHAQCLIERVTPLRKLGRSAEAVASAEAGLKVATPFLEFRAHQQLAWALLDANRFEDAYRQADALLALRPGDAGALELRVRALVGMGMLEDALYWTAPWVAISRSAEARLMRGDLHAKLGHHQLAAYSYLVAMQESAYPVEGCYPRYSAAIETYRAEHCATLPKNLLETLRPNRLLVRAAGDERPLRSPWGLVSQWQKDGRLQLTDSRGNGFVLAADGVGYSPLVDGKPSAEVLEPRDLGDGRLQYRMSPKTLVWAPDASIYFGSVNAFVPSWKGSWFDCTGISWKGPFLGYRATRFVEVLAESTYKEMREGREWVTKRTRLTGGLVDMVVDGYVGSTPTQFRSLDLSEHGIFHGAFASDRTPLRGLLVRTDGERAIVHDTEVILLSPKGQKDYTPVEGNTGESYTLLEDDVLEYRDHGGSMIQGLVRYLPDGRPPLKSNEQQVWIHADPLPEPDEPEGASTYTGVDDFGSSMRGARALRSCYRCKGTGMIWIAGGASQTSLSTPSYLFGSQAERWRNSSASIGTVYTSGHMGTCPVCKGEGGW